MRARLLAMLFLPLCILALATAGGGAWAIHRVVQSTNDRLLSGSLRAISDTLGLEDGQITLDLPPSALGMLDNADRDNVYYSVRLANKLITGYPELPIIDPRGLVPNQPDFRTANFNGEPIRVATEIRLIPRLREPVVVQVAETIRNRNAIENRMLGGLAVAEVLLSGAVMILTWIAVGLGLRPLSLLREEVRKRTAQGGIDFRPLPTRPAPSEVSAFVGAFNNLLSELDVAVNSLRRFTSDASHQMRTPLAVLRTHVELLNRLEPRTPAGHAIVHGIDSAVRKLQRLLVQLISLARAEELIGDRATTPSFDLGELAAEVAREFVDNSLAAGVKLSLEECGKNRSVVSGDPILAGEIIANIIDNAIRYNSQGGSVWLKVSTNGSLLIEDDGPGIPLSERNRVFERFYRIRRDTAREGSGLGLSIVRALADRIGARIELLDRSQGSGLCISIVFELVGNHASSAEGIASSSRR
jgi:two-component system, OmpR family, sensor histidine kinase TctE